MTEILLVEDDDRLRRALAITLTSQGHDVRGAGTVAEAVHLAQSRIFDCAIVDLGLPDGDGADVIRALRDSGRTDPVIVLSARRDQADKVSALDLGADDYVTKPFGVDELLARVRACLRRSQSDAVQPVLVTPDFTVDLGTKRIETATGSAVRLTPTEWGVLECLIHAQGMVVPSADLLRDVWGPQATRQTNYLRVYLAQLRQKLEPDPSRPRYLLTAPGIGYRFSPTGAG